MTPEIQQLEDSIKKVHRIAFTPKFKDTFQTKLSKAAFIAIAQKAIEQIGWEVVYYNDTTIEAERKNNWNKGSESICMSYDFGKVDIISTSLGNEMWDFGRNSKRVKLFQLVLQKIESELSTDEIQAVEAEQKKVDEWEDYVVPESLPAPVAMKKPNICIPLIGSLLTSVLFGYILALTISNSFYIIGLFDVGVGFGLGYVLSQCLKYANYTDFKKLRAILITSVVVAFISCQLFIYQLYVGDYSPNHVDFFTFMKLRFEAGVTIKSMNTGWIDLVISWGLLLFFGYLIGVIKLASGIITYQFSRVPDEVRDFATYLFIKDKSEDQVRMELSKRGWREKTDQDYVIEAVAAIGEAREMRRNV